MGIIDIKAVYSCLGIGLSKFRFRQISNAKLDVTSIFFFWGGGGGGRIVVVVVCGLQVED